MSTVTKTRSAILNVPESGRARDAYDVASTSAFLALHRPASTSGGPYREARHATLLHVISGKLHRIAEHECNGDPGYDCSACHGDGWNCKACGETGDPPRTRRLRAQAQEIAAHYGLACYFQGDPRGCSLYIGDANDMAGDNYDRGHAVVRLGR